MVERGGLLIYVGHVGVQGSVTICDALESRCACLLGVECGHASAIALKGSTLGLELVHNLGMFARLLG